MRRLIVFLALPVLALSCRTLDSPAQASIAERARFGEFLQSAERALGVWPVLDEVEILFPRTQADLEMGPSPEGHQPWTRDREMVASVELEPYFGPSEGEWTVAGEAFVRRGSVTRLTMIRGPEDDGILISAIVYTNPEGRCFTLKACQSR